MEPTSTPKLRAGSPSPSSPKLAMPTPPTIPSSSTSTTTSGLFSQSSSLSTAPASPLCMPTRSRSQVGRSQLNAASSATPNAGTSPGTRTTAPTTPEPGRSPALSWLTVHVHLLLVPVFGFVCADLHRKKLSACFVFFLPRQKAF